MAIHALGWKGPDLPDQRDFRYAAAIVPQALPASVDLRPSCPPVYDQGQLGSCTANAIAAAIQFTRATEKLTPDFIPSRLLIYYDERVIEHSVHSDSGAMIRDGLKTVAKQGACPETVWPYDIGKFAVKPPASAYAAAAKDRVTSYLRLAQDVTQMRACLASGYPFVFGFTVYQSFESAEVAQSGIVPMPGPSESVLGGHAVLAVGYDDASQRFIVRNSWSTGWGQAGYCWMPMAYLTRPDLASDFWTIRLTSS